MQGPQGHRHASIFGKKGILVLKHPLYSPDVSPYDYFLFPKLKIPMKGGHYQDVEEIQVAVTGVTRVLKAPPKVI